MPKKNAKKVEEEVETEDTPTSKYGIKDLCEILESEPHLVRAKLRAEGIEKNGKRYGWDTKSELQEVVDQLSERTKRKPKTKANDDDEAEEDEDEAPRKAAKKGAKKKAA